MSNDKIVVLKQSPILIYDKDKILKAVKERTERFQGLVIDEDQVKEIKKIRAEINSEFTALDTARKQIKKDILVPYEIFEADFKDFKKEYDSALDNIDSQVQKYDLKVKEQKKDEIEEYFASLKANYPELPFISFFHVFEQKYTNTSESMKKVRESIMAKLEAYKADVETLNAMENQALILAEYKSNGFILTSAIKTVTDRIKREQEEKDRIAKLEAIKKEAEEAKKAELVKEVPAVAFVKNIIEKALEQPKLHKITFTVTATAEQLTMIKELLKEEGIQYE